MKKMMIFSLFMIGIYPACATAAMQDMLNKMFMSNVTTPGSYQTQNRAGFVGGSVELRTPVKPITLAAFDPPRFNAGCGGLDMYGGSFSFINASQITALFRQIMSNAIGLMFQAAIAVIDPVIEHLVNYFQDVVNGLNKLSSNTCAIAHKLTDSTFHPEGQTTQTQDTWSSFTAATGLSSDKFSQMFSSPAKQQTAMAQAENTPQNANTGNTTWRALQRTSAFDMLDFFSASPSTGTISDNDYKAQILMSLLGTKIVTAAGAQTPPKDAAPSGSASSTSTAIQTPTEVAPVLRIGDLINDGKTTNTMYVLDCQSDTVTAGIAGTPAGAQFGHMGCPIVQSDPIQFSGTLPYIDNMLYGDPNQTDPTIILANAINYTAGNPMPNVSTMDILMNGNTGTLTVSQQQFLRVMPGPIARILINAQSDPANFAAIFPYLEKYAAVAMAVQIGESAKHAADAAWSKVKDIPEPEIVVKSIEHLNDDLARLRKERDDLSKNVQLAYELSKSVRQDNQNAR